MSNEYKIRETVIFGHFIALNPKEILLFNNISLRIMYNVKEVKITDSDVAPPQKRLIISYPNVAEFEISYKPCVILAYRVIFLSTVATKYISILDLLYVVNFM